MRYRVPLTGLGGTASATGACGVEGVRRSELVVAPPAMGSEELREWVGRGLGRLAAGLAHELNNQLTVVLCNLSVVAAGERDPEAQRWLGICLPL